MSLAELHGLGSLITLAAVAAFAIAAAAVAYLDRFHPALARLRNVLLGVIALQILIGAGTWLSGARPRDDLHLLYGAALLVALPLAGSYVTDVPPRAKAGVLSVAALVGLALIWRLSSTG